MLKAQGMDDVIVLAGGIIPDEDIPQVQALGVQGVFGPGTPLSKIVEFIREQVGRPEAA